MYEMDHGLRSSEGFIKKKSSSGCLIIKKKIDSSSGVGPTQRKFLGSNEEKERRNPRLSISGSSEDLLEPVRKVFPPRDDKFYEGPVLYGEGSMGNNSFNRTSEFEGERRKFNDNDGMFRKRMRKDDLQERYGIRRNLDIDSKSSPYFGDKSYLPVSPLRQNLRVPFNKTIRVQGKNGVLKVMVHKLKNVDTLRKYYDLQMEDVDRSGRSRTKVEIDVNTNLSVGSSFYSGLKHSENANLSARIENDESSLQNSLFKRDKADDFETELTNNRNKNMRMTHNSYDHQQQDLVRRGSNFEIGTNKNALLPLFDSDYKNRNSSSFKEEKSDLKPQNSLSKRGKAGDWETKNNVILKPESTDMVNPKKSVNMTDKHYVDHQNQDFIRRGSNIEIDINRSALDGKTRNSSSLKAEKGNIKLQSSSSKRVKPGTSESQNSDCSLNRDQIGNSSKWIKSEKKTPSTEKVTKGKESKVKRGTGTEKQLLREKIRHKLLNADWKIDYRPRKNRDYLDAVYINPSGTAYWSIIKAYEAFKKHMGEEDVPEELLNKLTRQTRKKMEKEMMLKQREEAKSKNFEDVREEEESENDDNDKTLSFLQKPNGKSLLKQKAEKSIADINSHLIHESKTQANDDNDEKLSFLPKPNGKSLKRKAEKSPIETNAHLIQVRKTQQIGISTLLVRNFDKGLKAQNDGYVPYEGKRTVLSWLIDSNTVNEGEKVQYMNNKHTKIMLMGYVTKDGIHCGCCSKIVTIWKFEIHAGSKLKNPFRHICLESGDSLLKCQVEAWNKQDEAKKCGFYNLQIDGDDGNDDACGVCGDGGDMICCDGCPSTFHQSCIGIQMLPPGDWHCPNCTCKFCERSSAPENALLACNMCERKYHKSCGEEVDSSSPADSDRVSTSFCGNKCQEMFSQLQKLLEVKHDLGEGFTWSFIHRTDIDTDMTQGGFPQKVECNSKLAVALSLIEECFLPINDRRSGINLIHNVLYNRGSNYSRLNHSGFYTAILEKGDEIIAAASIRIHGTQLAEMPIIGTCHAYRRQGMCRRLLCAIESALSSLKVKKLVIPAISENMRSFGFNPLTESDKREMRYLKMLVFPRTAMLQKMLPEQNTINEYLTAESGEKSILSKEHQQLSKNVGESSDFDPSFRHDSNVCDNASLKHPKEKVEGTATINSCSRATVSNADTSSDSSSSMPSESNIKVLTKEEKK